MKRQYIDDTDASNKRARMPGNQDMSCELYMLKDQISHLQQIVSRQYAQIISQEKQLETQKHAIANMVEYVREKLEEIDNFKRKEHIYWHGYLS